MMLIFNERNRQLQLMADGLELSDLRRTIDTIVIPIL